MKKQYIVGIMLVILIVAIIAVVLISGGYFEKSKFIGTWTTSGGGGTMTFTNDNKVTVTGQLGDISLSGTYTWAVAGEKITFTAGGSLGITLDYSFPTANQLILTNSNGNSVTLTK